ncbi:MAG: response regulator transcription factor [bacterium]|nr:response regulator transcription factor [bacterium]
MRILVVEDNAVLGKTLSDVFRQAGYAVDHVLTGEEAGEALYSQEYALVILDLGLPDIDGLEVLRTIRRRKSRVPILILTARDSLKERVEGLDLGADDYVGKPFDLKELEARARALIRRGRGGESPRLRNGPLVLDTVGRVATLHGVPLELPRRELSLLEVLMVHSGQVVAKERLLEKLFGFDDEVGVNAIEIYVHRLRKKLDPGGVRIRTVRGLGYLLEKP